MSDPKENKKPINLPENTIMDYNFERMLKSFKKQVEQDGIIEEIKRRKYYTKPSELKRLIKKSKRR
jgi:ribosomal protein S21